ncbi:hypothetical protein PMI04_017445 [Sphingobium sp. AP49]|uniref:hypothetical protein n=1 Tax=Sphingobium sp. AP49 TaxID=1144307 RepID=UPI00026EE1A3|nr:hypothetical protein [Sphingobium sp. AP49]WHO38321.1 hypothetical protein PMI04_017445 [Sphingobium sp. AP49]
MTRRDLAWRGLGLLLVGAAAGSSLLHRALTLYGPATTPLEMALAPASFTFASLGILLLCHGARLRDGWRRDLDRRQAQRDGHRDLPILAEDRAPLAALLAVRARRD